MLSLSFIKIGEFFIDSQVLGLSNFLPTLYRKGKIAKLTRKQCKMCFLQDGELRIICTSEYIYTQDFDFTWYPFDVQVFEIPSTLGNTQFIQQNFRCIDNPN